MSAPVRLGVIEDDEDIATLLEIAAQMDADVELVFVATTLADALDTLPDRVVDVVLLDRWLPDADTLDHVDQLRAVAGGAAIVMLSAEVPLRFRRPADEAGVDGYLDKTVLADVSRTPLSDLLGRVALVGAA